jgi:DNA repair exonuclease SbcCD ATPase subunit
MKRITFEKLVAKDFLSIGSNPITIDFQKGFNLVVGKNIDAPERKNAVGKSTVMSAFFYALFGETVVKVKNEHIPNHHTKGKGTVTLTFNVTHEKGTDKYKIERQAKPSKLALYKNDENVTLDSITNTTAKICDIIGSNPTICRSCDIMTLKGSESFFLKDAAKKRKFIEDIFNIEIFGQMLAKLKTKISENNTKISSTGVKIEELKRSIESSTEQYQSLIKQRDERAEKIKKEIEGLESQLSQLEKELADLGYRGDRTAWDQTVEKLIDASSVIDTKLNDLKVFISSTQIQVDAIDKELKKLNDVGTATCDKCFQEIPHTHVETIAAKKTEREEYKKALVKNINNAKEQCVKLADKKKLIQERMSSTYALIRQYELRLNKEKELELKIANTKLLIESSQNASMNAIDVEPLKKAIKESNERLDAENELLEGYKKTASTYDVCKFALGEEGVKSFVIKKLIAMLNSSIGDYINKFGLPIKCTFDEYFDEHISTACGKEFSYNNLSGAESRGVDLACLLSFSDMRRKISGISSNIEFYDEILDGGFDDIGLGMVVDTLKERIEKNDTACYAISHRKEMIPMVTGEIIKLEKRNNATIRVDN